MLQLGVGRTSCGAAACSFSPATANRIGILSGAFDSCERVACIANGAYVDPPWKHVHTMP